MKLAAVWAMTLAAVLSLGSVAPVTAGDCCQPCVPCCPPPPPPKVSVTWCVVDPCTGCSTEVTACLPECCKCQTPCLVSWKPGLLGRKILTYKFECGECIEVVLTKHGKAKARD